MSEKLRAENYGLPIGEKQTYNASGGHQYGRSKGKGATVTKYYELLDVSDGMKKRPGDVVRFNNKNVSPSIFGEYGVILDRYRIIKDKGTVFKDYYSIIMIITGRKKGTVLKMGIGMSNPEQIGASDVIGDFVFNLLATKGIENLKYFSEAVKKELNDAVSEIFIKHNLETYGNE